MKSQKTKATALGLAGLAGMLLALTVGILAARPEWITIPERATETASLLSEWYLLLLTCSAGFLAWGIHTHRAATEAPQRRKARA